VILTQFLELPAYRDNLVVEALECVNVAGGDGPGPRTERPALLDEPSSGLKRGGDRGTWRTDSRTHPELLGITRVDDGEHDMRPGGAESGIASRARAELYGECWQRDVQGGPENPERCQGPTSEADGVAGGALTG